MSNAVFPALPGIAWPVGKVPQFATRVQESASLREARLCYAVYPKYTIKLTFEFLRPAEYQLLAAFFLSRRGSFDSFLFFDQDDNAVADMQIGIGDGVRTQFQLARSFGTFVEPVENPVRPTVTVTVGGQPKAIPDYQISATGIVVFSQPVPAGLAVCWSGQFYYRVRFAKDTAEFSKFLSGLWELKTLDLIGATGNKV